MRGNRQGSPSYKMFSHYLLQKGPPNGREEWIGLDIGLNRDMDVMNCFILP